jgi:DNA-binding transcriptional regulator YhcF (GntR family)
MPDVPSYAQEEVIQLEPRPGTPVGKELLLFDTAEERVVFHGGAVIARYDIKDRTAEAAVRVMLARSGLVTQVELADAFRVHRNTLGRALRDLETGGMAAVLPAKRGPKGPYKVTPEVLELVAEHAEEALPELIRLLEQEGVHLSRSHIHLLQKRARNAAREQLELMSGAAEGQESEQDAEAPALGAEEAAEPALEAELEQPAVEVPAVEPGVVAGTTEPDALEAGREPPVRVPEQAEGVTWGPPCSSRPYDSSVCWKRR